MWWQALDAGYRLIDTAESYGNEAECGTVLQEYLAANPGVKRADIWIVTKCSSSRGDGSARVNLERQLAELQVSAIDLYYLHSWEPDPVKRAETWGKSNYYIMSLLCCIKYTRELSFVLAVAVAAVA